MALSTDLFRYFSNMNSLIIILSVLFLFSFSPSESLCFSFGLSRNPIRLEGKQDAYYRNKDFKLLESKVFSIFLPPQINLSSALSFNESGKNIEFTVEAIKKNNYLHIKSAEKSHREIDKFRIDSPSTIMYQHRLILEKEDGVRKVLLGKGPDLYSKVYVSNDFYCIQHTSDQGYFILTVINEELGEVNKIFLSARNGIDDTDINNMISSLRFKQKEKTREIKIEKIGNLSELDSRNSLN